MYTQSLISKVDRIANSSHGPWVELQSTLDSADEQDPAPLARDAAWEIASERFPATQATSYGELVMHAAVGRLKRTDLIRRTGDTHWKRAGQFPGIFGGPRGWCTACGFEVLAEHRTCERCGARQPAYEPSMAMFAFSSGVIACAWSIIATFTVVALALRHTVIFDVAVDEKFPEVLAILLAPAVMFSVFAVIFGTMAISAITAKDLATTHLPHAIYGRRLGWAACLVLMSIVIAATAFSVGHFRPRF